MCVEEAGVAGQLCKHDLTLWSHYLQPFTEARLCTHNATSADLWRWEATLQCEGSASSRANCHPEACISLQG